MSAVQLIDQCHKTGEAWMENWNQREKKQGFRIDPTHCWLSEESSRIDSSQYWFPEEVGDGPGADARRQGGKDEGDWSKAFKIFKCPGQAWKETVWQKKEATGSETKTWKEMEEERKGCSTENKKDGSWQQKPSIAPDGRKKTWEIWREKGSKKFCGFRIQERESERPRVWAGSGLQLWQGLSQPPVQPSSTRPLCAKSLRQEHGLRCKQARRP